MGTDEKYVLDLIADIIGEKFEWQKRFASLLGDTGKNGGRSRLPVDAFFPNNNLIVEYRKKQHSQPVNMWDRRMTIGGVQRRKQDRTYDLRKEKWAEDNEIRFMAVKYNTLAHNNRGRLERDVVHDREALKAHIEDLFRDYSLCQAQTIAGHARAD